MRACAHQSVNTSVNPCYALRVIYAILSQKGGAGKTTLAIHLADTLARRGRRVLLVDADEQATASKWAALRADSAFPVVGLPRPTLHTELPSIAADYEDVVLDAPPRIHSVARSVVLAADVIVVPVQPSPADVWATTETLELIAEGRAFNSRLRPMMAITRRIARSALARDVRGALSSLDVPVLRADLGQRVVFAEALASGRTVADVAPNSPAARELEALVDEITRLPS